MSAFGFCFKGRSSLHSKGTYKQEEEEKEKAEKAEKKKLEDKKKLA